MRDKARTYLKQVGIFSRPVGLHASPLRAISRNEHLKLNTKCVCPGVQVSASGCTNMPCWTVLTGVWISQSWSPSFSCSGWPCSSTLQNNEIRPEMFCCFWSNTFTWEWEWEFTSIVCSWSITDTDSVLCASEDRVILQSIWNTSIAPTWQFRL